MDRFSMMTYSNKHDPKEVIAVTVITEEIPVEHDHTIVFRISNPMYGSDIKKIVKRKGFAWYLDDAYIVQYPHKVNDTDIYAIKYYDSTNNHVHIEKLTSSAIYEKWNIPEFIKLFNRLSIKH